jgi:hypothetical protein
LHSGLSYCIGDAPRQFKSLLIKHHDFRAPKNGKYEVSIKLGSGCFSKAANGKLNLA